MSNTPDKNKLTPIRKQALKRLGLMVLGLVPVFLLSEEKGPLRFVLLAGFLFAMFQLLMLIRRSPQIVDDLFPPKDQFGFKAKPFDQFMYYFSTGFFLVSIFLLLFQINPIDNTINGTNLFWKFGGIGVLIAIAVTVVFKIVSPTLYHEGKRRYSIHFNVFVGFFLLSPAIACLVNRNAGGGPVVCKAYTNVSKGKSSKGQNWIFVTINNQEERFAVSYDFYDSIAEPATVQLCTRTGKLGYEIMVNYRTAE